MKEGSLEEYYTQKEIIGKSLYYNIIIKRDLTQDCNKEKCSLCPNENPDICVSCNDDYYFNSTLNKCVSKPEEKLALDTIESTIQITTIPTTQVKTTIPTTQITTIPTTQISTIPTTQITTILTTQISTTVPKTQITTVPTTQITTISTTQITTIPETKILTTQKKSEVNTLPTSKITTVSKNEFITLQTTGITNISKTDFITLLTTKTTNLKYTGVTSLFSENIGTSKISITSSIISSLIGRSPSTYINTKEENSILYSEELSSSTITKTTLQIKCSTDKILENKCKEKITPEQTQEIYTTLKEDIKKGEYNKTNNTIILTENVIFQISTLKEQENDENLNISIIDFSNCEEIIRQKYSIKDGDELIMLKSDILNEDSNVYVQYEIYNPYTLEYIHLDICNEVKININFPIVLNGKTESLYLSLSKSGYNLFDINDSFYHDICSTYTTENGTDIILMDRLNIFYDSINDIYLCQDGCEFIFYNETSKRAKCNCNIQRRPTIINIKEILFDKKKLVNNFLLSSLKNSNFQVMKCYKLIFSLNGQIGNIGSYMLLSIIFILIVLMIFYYVKGNKQLYEFTQIVIRQRFLNSKKNKKNKNVNLTEKLKDKKINKK